MTSMRTIVFALCYYWFPGLGRLDGGYVICIAKCIDNLFFQDFVEYTYQIYSTGSGLLCFRDDFRPHEIGPDQDNGHARPSVL